MGMCSIITYNSDLSELGYPEMLLHASRGDTFDGLTDEETVDFGFA